MSDFATKLEAELGSDIITLGADIPAHYRHDWAGLPEVLPLALARPRNTGQVAKIMALCHEAGVPVVPQGGLTGISGAAQPMADGVALSLDRMNRILKVDAAAGVIVAEPGVVLETAQKAAAEADMMLGIDIGARGSCQLGGVIATNAGGNNVIRYGMARDHVLGLEVVLADGTVLDGMNTLLKNNAGLDLKQLFIGSEGLLGIITGCVLRLQPQPPQSAAAFLGVPSTEAAISLLQLARGALGPSLSAFEVMWPSFFHTMAERCHMKSPLVGQHAAYVIIEATGFDAATTQGALETLLEKAFEQGLVEDGVLASSVKDQRAFWEVRESPAEYATVIGPIIPFDCGIPIGVMAEAVARIEAAVAEAYPTSIALTYGHIGDQNLHFVVHVPGDAQPEKEIKSIVYGITRDYGGAISAEHGIGAIKRDYLAYSRTPAEIATMRAVKAALDPRGILNPMKSFDGVEA